MAAACSSRELSGPPAGTTFSTDSATGTGTGTDTDTEGCAVGQVDCPCDAMQSCEGNLVCIQDTCVDPNQDCPIGAEGCPCTGGGACDPGLTCLSMVCVDPG